MEDAAVRCPGYAMLALRPELSHPVMYNAARGRWGTQPPRE